MSRRNFKYGWSPRGKGTHCDSDFGEEGLILGDVLGDTENCIRRHEAWGG